MFTYVVSTRIERLGKNARIQYSSMQSPSRSTGYSMHAAYFGRLVTPGGATIVIGGKLVFTFGGGRIAGAVPVGHAHIRIMKL